MEQAMNFLEKMAAELGVAAESVFSIMTKQHFADGIASIVTTLLGLLFVVTLMCCIPRLLKAAGSEAERLAVDRCENGTGYCGSHDTPSYIEDFWNAMKVIIPIAAAIVLVVTVIVIPDTLTVAIQKLINPEYFAIREILDGITNTVG